MFFAVKLRCVRGNALMCHPYTKFLPDLTDLHVTPECRAPGRISTLSACTEVLLCSLRGGRRPNKYREVHFSDLFVMLLNCCVLMVKVCCDQSAGQFGETASKQMIGPQQMCGGGGWGGGGAENLSRCF